MKRLFPSFTILVIICLAILAGCHGNPASPPTVAPELSATSTAESSPSNHKCLGYNLLKIDTENFEFEVVPLRTSEWHFNLVGVLNNTMGVSAAIVPGESIPSEGLFVLDITLSHPFATKPQFSGFDVKGVLITPGTLDLGPFVLADTDETRLENADGYTRWWNPTEFTNPGIFGYTQGILANAGPAALTATVNPYKLFADILGPIADIAYVSDEPLDSDKGRCVFSAGRDNARRYNIRFPMDPGPQIVYGYAIDCSWDAPSPNPPDEIPDDFPIEANQPESYRVAVIPTANTLYYDSESGIGGGVLRLQINVHDWQGQVAGDFPGEVSAVRILAPGMMSGVVDGVFLNQASIKGRYTADLTGLAVPTEAGDKLIVCRVESSDGSTYQQATAPAPDDPLSAFHVITLDIPDPECEGDATNDWSEAIEISFGDAVADQVCLPDDYRDFYSFEIPPGFVTSSGELRLYCDAEPTKLGLYDESQTLITESDISGGTASIDLDAIEILPGSYYIRIWTSNSTQVAPYLLELYGELESRIPSNVTDITPPGWHVRPEYIYFHGDYMYCFGESGIWVFDISTHTNPRIVYGLQESGFSELHDATFRYPYCYYAVSTSSTPAGEIRLIDFSDPALPVRTEEILTFDPEEPVAVTMNSEHLYVATNEQPTPEFRIYDWVTDPLNPVLLANQDIPIEATTAILIDPEGDYTNLVLTGQNAFYCYDVEDPGSISGNGSLGVSPMYEITDIAVHGQEIYLAYWDSVGQVSYMNTYTLVFGGPIYNDYASIPGEVKWIEVKKPYAYLASGSAGIVVCDITDVGSVSVLNNYEITNNALNLALSDDFLCIRPQGGSFIVMDLSTPSIPLSVYRHKPIIYPGRFYFTDDELMLVPHTNDRHVISTVDISDPLNMVIMAEGEVAYHPDYAAVDWEEEQMVISNEWNFAVLDISDPLNITSYPNYISLDLIDAIAIKGRAVYCGFRGGGTIYIHIYSISDPSSPSPYTTLTYSSISYPEFLVHDNILLVTDDKYVRIYSLSSELMPDYIDSITASGYVNDIKIADNYLYLNLSNTSVVEIWDISNPLAPVKLGSGINGTISSGDMAIDGQFAYFSGNDPNIHACWIYPPDEITPYGKVYPDPFAGAHLEARDGILYKITLGRGFRIFDLY